MHQDLKAILAKTGNTPLKEPKIYDMVSGKDGARPSQVFKAVAPNLDITSYNGKEVAEFVNKIVEKVTSFLDDDGEFKVTDATKDCDQPNYMESEELYYLVLDKAKAEEKKKEAIEKQIEELIWKVAKLKKESMTEWEQMLVYLQVQRAAIDNTKTALGIQVKN